jgi:uncharacterized protein
MSDAVLERLTSEALAGGHDVVFHWHGGEPLLAGIDFYERAVALQRAFSSSGQVVTNTVQTNGTLLNDRWVRLFVRHNPSAVRGGGRLGRSRRTIQVG